MRSTRKAENKQPQSLLSLPFFEQRCSQVRLRPGTGRIEGQRFLKVDDCPIQIAGQRQRRCEVSEPGRVLRVESAGLAVFLQRFALLVVSSQGRRQDVMRQGSSGSCCRALRNRGNSRRKNARDSLESRAPYCYR